MDLTKTINTPYNNAVALINRMNELLRENNILDSTGAETAQMDQNPTNPGWLFALACGSLHTSWQEQLSKAYAALDPQSCEEDQVLVLAALAGLERGNGTPSHLTALFANTSTSATVTIPANSTFTESYSNQTWVLNKEITLAVHDPSIPDSGTQHATLYCAVDGSIYVPQGTALTPEEGLTGFTVLADADSYVGEDIESIASLRNRLSQGAEQSDFKIQAKNAIALLSGIESCTIWFNSSYTNTLNLGDPNSPNYKQIPPRECYLAVKGADYSQKIAETYFKYLDVPATIGAEQETCRIGQQDMTVNFDYAVEVTVPIWVTIRGSTAAVGAADAIKARIASYSGTLACGENLTNQKVAEWLQNLGYGEIVACNVGTSDGIQSTIDACEYCVFTTNDITVSDI